MKNTKKLSIFAAIILFFTFSLAGCQNNQEKAKPKTDQITVTYTLKDNKKTFANKKVHLKKNSTVATGLKKNWKVKSQKEFITAIDGKSQNPQKKIYWTYTVNGKMVNKSAYQQKLKNTDKVVFTRSKY